MKDLLKNVGICIISGFATQVGMLLAQEMFCKINDKKNNRPIGFGAR